VSAANTIRPLTDAELPAFVAIAAGAYPALRLHMDEERQQRAE
jgi:hypothetical protein